MAVVQEVAYDLVKSLGVRPVSHARGRTRVYRRLRPRSRTTSLSMAYASPARPPSPPHAPDLHTFAAPLAGRGRRRVPVPASRRRRAGREEERPVSAARRGRGPARRDLGAAAARARPRPRDASGRARGRGSSPGSARCSGRAFCCRCCSPRRGARSRATSTCTGARRGARRARRSRCTLARESAEHATTLNHDLWKDRRAVASHGVGRLSAQRRLRIQRRTDGELRSRRRRDRRVGAGRRITR